MIRKLCVYALWLFFVALAACGPPLPEARAEDRNIPVEMITDRLSIDPPPAGNPHGDVTIIEFFDYGCGLCKKSYPVLSHAVVDDGNIRWELKELPLLGADSFGAAMYALAVARLWPARYFEFHKRMLAMPLPPTQENTARVIEELGIDLASITNEFKSEAVRLAIIENKRLAAALGIISVPTLVVGGTVLTGPVDSDAVKSAVARTRAARSTD